MFLSVFDIFKIGIGPSSSHTVGPMAAAARFLQSLEKRGITLPARIMVSLHGSLAFTGKGHGTDRACMLGLLGERPDTVDPNRVDGLLIRLAELKRLTLPWGAEIEFDPGRDIFFDYETILPGHANGMKISARAAAGNILLDKVYYSIGGGFVAEEDELDDLHDDPAPCGPKGAECPYPFANAKQMLAMGVEHNLSIAQMKRANEQARYNTQDLNQGLDDIWQAMRFCIDRGLAQHGVLPGHLGVKRRAGDLHDKLQVEWQNNRKLAHVCLDWLSVYAMAVNEENAAGGRIVTAPTNGAAGVLPAVLRYHLEFCPGVSESDVHDFLLTAAAIGGIIKHNASISGAEVGCQGEVGSAAAMAAAGLCAVLGGSNAQVENAAEIALEHHLGMTCDPIGGLVQVPCIERNALGAVKAVTAASLALKGDGTHFVPLDSCIETMRQTGLDMNEKYKETSRGGLAVSAVEC